MATRGGARGALPGSVLLVIHDFAARGPDELTLAKGDRIKLIERDDEFGDGWFLGEHLTNGQSGLFPEVYTTPAPKPTLPPAVRPPRAVETVPVTTPSPTLTSPSASFQQQQSPTSSSVSRSSVLSNNQSPLIQPGLRTKGDSGRTSIGNRNISMSSDSPVMSETLSVIDEHITDMHTPRSSYTSPTNKRESVSSMYSSHPLARRSYIAGAETDEEEQQLYTEEEVNAWSPTRVAEYLEDIGVERAHCDVFVDQDISGEVLLAMDQNSLFIKEFELGSVGRRLKTWHRIKALQDEVRRASIPAPAPPPVPPLPDLATLQLQSPPSAGEEKERETSRTRSSTVGSPSPAGLGTSRPSPPVALARTKTPSFSFWSAPTMSIAANNSAMAGQAQSTRPSAQNVRNLNHSRRHSSIDSTSTDGANRLPAHRKQPSMDQRSVLSTSTSNTTTTNGKPLGHNHTTSVDSHANQYLATGSPSDLDRGYFSSTEVESRNRKTLIKRAPSGATNASSGHVRSHSTSRSAKGSISSVPNIHEEGGPDEAQPTKSAFGAFESLRIATVSQFTRKAQESPVTPASAPARDSLIRTVSKGTSVGSPRGPESDGGSDISALPPVNKSGADDSATGSSTLYNSINNKFEALRSAVGSKRTSEGNSSNRVPSGATTLVSSIRESDGDGSGVQTVGIPYQNTAVEGNRSTSEAVTKQEKAKDSILSSPSWTGNSSTPSGTPTNTDKDTESARASTGSGNAVNLPVPPPSSKRARGATTSTPARSKKQTSAYTRGLENKTPAEQIPTADYYGWMSKKSGSLMTTWKPRFFILRGRRLSYYYSENDTAEKGLIDISFHRVLPAHNETLVGLHATMTGAASGAPSPAMEPLSPTRINHNPSATTDSTALTPATKPDDDTGLFIFKLLPPKTGFAKGVNFTKPTVHYFALPSRSQGRLWMAALMKATIDRDPGATVTTTYNQKTISLAKARARKERPDALREAGEDAASIGSTAASGNTRDSMGGYAGGAEEEDGSELGRGEEGAGTGLGILANATGEQGENYGEARK